MNPAPILWLHSQILSFVYQHASNGSGWRIRRIDETFLKMVKSASIRVPSYLSLPANFLKTKRFFLNIRNYEEDRCFEYHFNAEYHRQTKSPHTHRTMQSKEEKKVSFYNHRRIRERTNQLGTLSTQWDYRLLNALKLSMKRKLTSSG